MTTQKQYWNQKISEWTNSSYDRASQNTPLIEKVATFFRAVSKRMNVTLEVLGDRVKGKTVIDLGCGLGDLCFEMLKYKPKKVIGMDISEVAVKEAQKRAKNKKIQDKVSFVTADVAQLKKIPPGDIVIGLGFIDYLNEEELRHLFSLLSGRQYFFSYFEKKLSLLNMLHAVYIKLQNCPGAYKYTREEIKKMIPKNSKYYILEKDGLAFITNIAGLDENYF